MRVKSARKGSRRAFAALWKTRAATVHGILLSIIPEEDVHDLMQEVALSALQSISNLADPAKFDAWLCTIARNKGRDALRVQQQKKVIEADLLQVAEEPPQDYKEEADIILAHIRALPECYREPLVLRLVSEMSGSEIAARVAMTPGSVRVNLHRGMTLLRESLEKRQLEVRDE